MKNSIYILCIAVVTLCSCGAEKGQNREYQSIDQQVLELLQNSQKLTAEEYFSYFITPPNIRAKMNQHDDEYLRSILKGLLEERNWGEFEGIKRYQEQIIYTASSLRIFNLNNEFPADWENLKTINVEDVTQGHWIYKNEQIVFDGKIRYKTKYTFLRVDSKDYLLDLSSFQKLN